MEEGEGFSTTYHHKYIRYFDAVPSGYYRFDHQTCIKRHPLNQLFFKIIKRSINTSPTIAIIWLTFFNCTLTIFCHHNFDMSIHNFVILSALVLLVSTCSANPLAEIGEYPVQYVFHFFFKF